MKQFLILCVAGMISLSAVELPAIPLGKAAYWQYVEANTVDIYVDVKWHKGTTWGFIANELLAYDSSQGHPWKVAQAHLKRVLDKAFNDPEKLREYDRFSILVDCSRGIETSYCWGSQSFTLQEVNGGLGIPVSLYELPPSYDRINLNFTVEGIAGADFILRKGGEEVEWIQSFRTGKGGTLIVIPERNLLSIPYKCFAWEDGGELYLHFSDETSKTINLPSPPPSLMIAPLDWETAKALGRQSSYGFKLTIQNTGGRPLVIEYSSDFKSWHTLYEYESSDPRGETYVDAEPNPSRFYRVRTN